MGDIHQPYTESKANKQKGEIKMINKNEIIAQYATHEGDTGSPEVQIALLTARINHLTEHLKLNRKDFGTERALTNLVGKRRRLLDYLKAKDIEKYRALIKELGIRK